LVTLRVVVVVVVFSLFLAILHLGNGRKGRGWRMGKGEYALMRLSFLLNTFLNLGQKLTNIEQLSKRQSL